MESRRLDRVIAAAIPLSRREVKDLIGRGAVTVDGAPARSPQEKVPPAAVITVRGQRLSCQEHLYIMLHKPAGVLSATRDPRTPTALDFLPPPLRRRGMFPAGRLDKDATGLLLLTDDGPLAHRLLSPRRHVDKEYRIQVQGQLTEADCAALAAGLRLPDGLHCLPAQMRICAAGAVSTACVILHEGKYHQLKRMLACLGKPVLTLHRLRMGNLTLDPSLSPGQCRPLTPEEAAALKDLTHGAGKEQNFHKK